MMLQFKPAVYQSGVLHELPRPVRSMRIQDGWDFEQFKVPLKDGDHLVGHSFRGVDLSLEGEVGSQAGVLKLSEEAMLNELFALRDVLDVSSADEKYSFVLYQDETAGTYRRFKACSTVEFEYDLSHPQLFTYTLKVHAEDPVLYQTDPALD